MGRHPWPLVALVLLALVVRAGVLVLDAGALKDDPDAYRQLGENLAATGTLGFLPPLEKGPPAAIEPTAFRPPLYPLVVAAAALTGQLRLALGLFHGLFGAATCLIVYAVARRYLAPAFAALAGALAALDPLLVRHSLLVMTETLAALLVALALLAANDEHGLSPRRILLLGFILGLLAICRPVFLVAAAMLAIWLFIAQATWRKGARQSLLFAAAIGLVLGPWIARNWMHWRALIPGTTHGGYTLYLANNESFYAYLQQGAWGEVWRPEAAADRGDDSAERRAADALFLQRRAQFSQLRDEDERLADRQAYEWAWTTIRAEPGDFLQACVVRLGRFWQLVPHKTVAEERPRSRLLRYAIGLWYAGTLFLAAVGAARLKARWLSPPWIVLLLLAASLMLVHLLFWTNMRMRAPLQPGLALLAAIGANAFCGRFCRNSAPTLT